MLPYAPRKVELMNYLSLVVLSVLVVNIISDCTFVTLNKIITKVEFNLLEYNTNKGQTTSLYNKLYYNTKVNGRVTLVLPSKY